MPQDPTEFNFDCSQIDVHTYCMLFYPNILSIGDNIKNCFRKFSVNYILRPYNLKA